MDQSRRRLRVAPASRSALAFVPQAPASIARTHAQGDVSSGHGRDGSGGSGGTRGSLVMARAGCRGRGADLDEFDPTNRHSVSGGRHGARLASRHPVRQWRHGIPASPDLVTAQRPPLTVETAIPKLCRNGATEMPTGQTGGAGATANPASSRLGLGCRTVRTAPDRHCRMVAANGPAVHGRIWTRSPAIVPAYFRIVMTVKSSVEPKAELEARTLAAPWPTATPLGMVVSNEAPPFASVLRSATSPPM